MADELQIPTVPEARSDDSEDVSWALSTAEAMWARGEHADGIKWLRKAAEAASDADQDVRALELAKAASDLASLLARRSAADAGPSKAARAEPSPALEAPRVTPATRSSPPLPSASKAPSAPPRASVGPPKAFAGRSSPPLPSASVPPSASAPSGASSSPPHKAPRPFSGTAPGARPSAAPAARASTLPKSDANARKARRRSRENLDEEARIAALPMPPTFDVADRETARDIAAESQSDNTTEVPALRMQIPVERSFDDAGATAASRRRRSRPDDAPDSATPASRAPGSRFKDEMTTATGAASASRPVAGVADWDASPTQSLSSSELQEMDGIARLTAPAAAASSAVTPSRNVRAPAKTVHDEEIRTSQAVRVVVWRDGNGVHVAPAGTVVSAITVDAMLVALEPGADLTAWLSRRER
jgi:hypothetical protein